MLSSIKINMFTKNDVVDGKNNWGGQDLIILILYGLQRSYL